MARGREINAMLHPARVSSRGRFLRGGFRLVYDLSTRCIVEVGRRAGEDWGSGRAVPGVPAGTEFARDAGDGYAMPDDSTKLTTCTCSVEDGVVIFECFKDAHIDLDEARRITAVLKELGGGGSNPVLVDLGEMKSLSKQARHHLSRDPEHAATFVAAAIVANNPLATLIANFFLGINKPIKPTKLFDSRQKALAWLHRHMDALDG